jgi:type I restriction-modification system DNA methylase subunit
VVANPPFSYRWDAKDEASEDPRFKNYGVAPKSAADFAFLLHGLHYLKDDGVMAIILPHGVLFRGGVEERNISRYVSTAQEEAEIDLAATRDELVAAENTIRAATTKHK